MKSLLVSNGINYNLKNGYLRRICTEVHRKCGNGLLDLVRRGIIDNSKINKT